MIKKYINEFEAAELFGLNVHWLRRKRCIKDEHSPPYTKLGKRVLYPVNELEQFLQQRINN